ncbi:hypothetical protein A2631_00135 [Candidatus Daviesbacteria bacterium RIFCSPHIGHO2_01_FULL_44_29]|uniref:Major facilitator superfamily (MFS) profile domain-containing protein n=1 Tax=Candidatus Daviesbacteria bacterium RIFCSPHIGHO2_02_FULL_43_12 TaxID=1797776 RepID=A0A1F5KHY5_9BACT|nr:MAG: hypothetical protein A2631_00135 [Candidatus Daviesbacteria bacterium RIFCSPHIGHO2_01_FULL_44_29]OGE40557.1 MAG: hypothetical protein A3D25_00360 [Candidatus Daviesbacteria bacterium RIFCSPHIGHO2_02_FULL_43_12]OGE40926.1 MAG: hypothetical protein A3E86_05560 [Candidatus Daviesbacteria bacterium RIFCSPHIGHO2_12_FULL_47_45]OGE70116.1 MAG: hypothetical protein A3B55_00130 [Candidatus Daviesbacteria bacterium RIFCSPLOWO2_01_FULL_43_15]
MEEKDRSVRSVLANPAFTKLWSNQIFVQLAYNSLNFTLLLWVFKLASSNTAVSGLMLSIYLPPVIFGVFAGVFVDLFDRRKIMRIIDLLMALCFVGLIFFKDYLPTVYLFTFLVNTLAIFYLSSEASAIPIIVKKSQLLLANSLFSTTVFLSFLVGFGLSGPLISLFSIDFVFGLGALVLFMGFLSTFSMPSMRSALDDDALELKNALRKRSIQGIDRLIRTEIRKTINLIKDKPQVLTAILIISMEQAIVGVLGVLIPSFLERVVHIKATDASIVLVIPLGVGMSLGGLFIGKLGHLWPKRRIVATGTALAGLLLGLVGSGPFLNPISSRIHTVLPFFYRPSHAGALVVGSFLLGLAMVSVIVPSQTAIQEETPENTRGKVFSVLNMTMSGLALVPILVIGPLSDIIGPALIFVLIGLTVFWAGITGLYPKYNPLSGFLPKGWRTFLGN